MSIFKNFTTEGMEEARDTLGGFQVLESGIYTGVVKHFYAGESRGGAMSLTLIVDLGGREYRETLWITNKNKENFFINKKSGKKSPLPGFTVANDICLITTGKELHEITPQEKVATIYDFDAKAEVNKNVPTIVEAIGQKISLGILKELHNKREEVNGEWVDTAETREENVIDKVFHPDLHLTVVEARQGKTKLEEATFWGAWEKRNKGQVRDRRTIKDGQGSSTPPSGGNGGGTVTKTKSLFGS